MRTKSNENSTAGEKLSLDEKTRRALWEQVENAIENFTENVGELPIFRGASPEAVRSLLTPFDFKNAVPPEKVVEQVVRGLTDFQTHFHHPLYTGLYNSRPSTMGIYADALAAGFNSQLASWTSSSFGVEVEQHLIRAFGEKVGYRTQDIAGTFTSGGTEANHTALILALTSRFPEYLTGGVLAIGKQVVLYTSVDSHHSIHRSVRLCGLGDAGVRDVPVGPDLAMDVGRLAEMIQEDRRAGKVPFMVIATAGTSGSGVIDPCSEIAEVARKENLWFHFDGAFGGPGVLLPELKNHFAAAALADSISFDPHKWMSVPMGAGMVLTRHFNALDRAFSVDFEATAKVHTRTDVTMPWRSSIQWSRRFIGLKLFMTLATVGWSGYESVLRHQVAMADKLRQELKESGWKVLNKTPLPVVCFTDAAADPANEPALLERIRKKIVESGQAWVSTLDLVPGQPALRAAIVNYSTSAADVTALVGILNETRAQERDRKVS